MKIESTPASSPLPPRLTFLLLVLPMLATVLVLRLYLHLVQVQHVYPGGYLVHHLFTGAAMLVPAAFVLAFGTRFRWLAIGIRVVVGVSSGLILDEMTYLIMTGASDSDYVSAVSLNGAVIFVTAALLVATGLYVWHENRQSATTAARRTV